MVDVALLARTLADALAPALPRLLKIGDEATREATEKLGSGTLDRAEAIWKKLLPKFREQPAVSEILQDVAIQAEDPDARAALRFQLKKLLAADPKLAEWLARALESGDVKTVYQARVVGSGVIAQGAGAVAAGERGVAIGGDAHRSVVITGNARHVRGKSDGG